MYTRGPADSKPAAARLRALLLLWYRRDGRDLPWRKTSDPYRILVSEVMLQQTQVARVVPAYRAFLRRFPSLGSLARASAGDVLRAWAGLGYNRRALNLWRAARAAGRSLPRGVEQLHELPGIGPYTAGAVECFAHGTPVPFADTNIRRVLGRIALGRLASDREALALDAELLPKRRAAEWHHALMDLGAMLCVARRPKCDVCPVAALCAGRGTLGESAKRRQEPFASSERRVRGAIIRALGAAPRRGISGRALEEIVDDPRTVSLVAALVQEGLAERRGPLVRLPL